MKISVTHENVKSSSILLDNEFNAIWSDYYLTTVPVLSHRTSQARNDYASPEYIATGKLTMKSDVYSFGIILLELLCGLRVFDKNRPMKKQNLVVWAKPYLSNKRKLLQIVDSRLEDLYPHDEAYKFGKVAFKCLSLDPKLRPSMAEVVDVLEQFGPDPYSQNQTEVQTGIDRLMEPTRSSNWPVLGPDPSSPSILVLQEAMALQFDVIEKATRNFTPDILLGEGRYGPVYKGIIHEHPLSGVKLEPGIVVAVKNLSFKRVAGSKECLERLTHLSKIPSHPNLTKLIGYCLDKKNMILVYEFVCFGGLDYHLFTRVDQSLSWEIRLKVAVGAARALAFLHFSGIEFPYWDFNSGDILLDGVFNAKLSDYWVKELSGFGSLKIGYEPPETPGRGHMYSKSNVYSFGVVLLELLTGRQACDVNQPPKEQILVIFAKPYLGSLETVLQIVDPRLEGRFSREEVYEVAKIASRCLILNPRDRPEMSEVVASLEQLSK